MTARKLKRKIERVKRKLKSLEDREKYLSKYGYWDIGYLKGQISILEDWLDVIKE